MCGDTIPELPGDCCFTVIYYDTYEGGNYRINVTSVFYDKTGCKGVPKEEVIDLFVKYLYQKKVSDDPSFIEDHYPEGWEHCGITLPLITTGKCFNDDTGELCDPEERCCVSKYHVCIDAYQEGDGYVYKASEIYFGLIDLMKPSCNTHPCSVTVCRQEVPYQVMGSLLCDVNCNFGVWTAEKTTSQISTGCGNCDIIIHYRERTTQDPNCPVTYKDFELLEIEFVNCSNCNWSEVQFHEFAIDYLLTEVGTDGLSDGECIMNRRALTKQCWELQSNQMIPCIIEHCCWAVYNVCNENGQIVYDKISTGSTGDPTTCDPTQACELICDTFPPKKSVPHGEININREQKSYAVPNPATGNVSIHYNSEINGEIKISVYDNIGNLVESTTVNKSNYQSTTDIDLSEYKSGLYLFKISNDKKVLSKGNFLNLK